MPVYRMRGAVAHGLYPTLRANPTVRSYHADIDASTADELRWQP